ncbi:TonB-dependent receptor [Alteriqipengyuania lutimaris]|uniref:TonB-dependent receptor n=1 Tax=Alteriqipengyuania lutimaris TaxID=1538146 RepID=UPI00185CCD64|nr:TonB-dependent receptor [Alteriqipengyuania lutimaris]MBB3033845.1 TonB-dependent receptor [Alteriqipengyuania lutimaris]
MTNTQIRAPRQSWRSFALMTVSGIALTSIAQPAFAQDAAQPAGEDERETEAGTPEEVADQENVIIVSGFRASLSSAQNIKRNADTFVDVITAEDIGALPDRSVAEALQRVPGVNISRFEQRDDPDRFSVEGSGVIIRGLPYVRSELNGRDIFSANGGRTLSFNDVSPELLGRVEVFKNNTADMIEGSISGTVNLVTRKPLDNRGTRIAGTVEANYGDFADEWSPGFSILGAHSFETDIGTFGLQVGYAQSELKTRTDASQVTDPCYRAPTLDGPCIRVRAVGDAGFSGDPIFGPDNFPPEGSVVVPKGAGVRTTDLVRDRNAISAIGQWESSDESVLLTLEYLRAETEATLDEYSLLALVNNDALFPVPAAGTSFTFDENGIFESGTLTQGGGIPTEALRFQREDEAKTEDFSFDLNVNPSDRLGINMEVQHIRSDRQENGLIGAMQTSSDIFLDNSGNVPIVQFLQPGTSESPASYFSDPDQSYYWFLIDNQVRNEGELWSMRADVDYDIADGGESFFRTARFGARWSDRNRVTRTTNFSNWGNLSAPWTGGGAVYADDYPASQLRSPFVDFQRGNVPVPAGDGSAFFFGGDDLVDEYLSGLTEEQARELNARSQTPNPFIPIYARNDLVDGTPYRAGEISNVDESSFAAYGRLDFGSYDFLGNGWDLQGNIGVRYVRTSVNSGGSIGFPSSQGFELTPSGEIDFAATCSDLADAPGGIPGFCQLSPERQAQFAAVFDNPTINDSAAAEFDYWLPSFNAKLDVGGGLLFRVGASKGIFRPDLALYRTGGVIGDNTNTLRQEGTLETGPLFALDTGNRLLTATESWNYDLSVEYYFSQVGSLTVSAFLKDLSGIVNAGATTRSFTTPDGVDFDVRIDGPDNTSSGILKGVEVAYQHTFDFLPSPLDGLGTQLTYTYVDAGDFTNPDLDGNRSLFAEFVPLAGVSKHTVNATVFYEKGPLSARAAYNWRSEYLQTPRDVIFPFSPIYGEATGQLDASIFFSVTDDIKIGVQGVNLLDEITRTSQVIDFDGTRVTRSAFRNDRRYTFIARFDF